MGIGASATEGQPEAANPRAQVQRRGFCSKAWRASSGQNLDAAMRHSTVCPGGARLSRQSKGDSGKSE